ncbi:hypothetical protein KSP40_PGU021782 [Platanthera guangdongensis]|uniref:Bifunctional inhibitor/plant lipid transfer protein/seed storage helical domain-containing protein n=1 Tax=Platanthera guangdongensis TaxID=2320717 RepID=A0ABR2LQB8_9ASPA
MDCAAQPDEKLNKEVQPSQNLQPSRLHCSHWLFESQLIHLTQKGREKRFRLCGERPEGSVFRAKEGSCAGEEDTWFGAWKKTARNQRGLEKGEERVRDERFCCGNRGFCCDDVGGDDLGCGGGAAAGAVVRGEIGALRELHRLAEATGVLLWPGKRGSEGELPCLCSLFNNPQLIAAFSINLTQALQLPKKCGIQSSQPLCNSTSTSTPISPAKGSPHFYECCRFATSKDAQLLSFDPLPDFCSQRLIPVSASRASLNPYQVPLPLLRTPCIADLHVAPLSPHAARRAMLNPDWSAISALSASPVIASSPDVIPAFFCRAVKSERHYYFFPFRCCTFAINYTNISII